jgi:uncharacterized protein (TIGR03083 family)
MENARLLQCLEADYRRMRDIVPGHLDARVPSCPDWTVDDLAWHVGMVYLHKVTTMREGAEPKPWPPSFDDSYPALTLLDDAYRQLRDEFAARDPADPMWTWYAPDQTVGFWIRRMAQETVIHRIDAELGVREQVTPVADDLAIDGIDELLKVFVAFDVSEWPKYFTAALQDSPGRSYLIRADVTTDSPSVSWLVKTAPGQFTAEGGPEEKIAGDIAPDVTVSGTPTDMLRWSWNRETPGMPSRVKITGDGDAVAEFRACVTTATQWTR